MPSRSKKKRAIKRKKEKTNHQTPTNSSAPQGNGTNSDHDDSSEHPLTDEDFSPRASMEAKPEPDPEPEPEPEVSEDVAAVSIEQPTVSKWEQSEVTTAVPLEVLQESSAPREIREKSGEESSYSERTDIPVAISRETPATGPAPLLERRASWWNCCGLLDVFRGSQR